MKFLANENFPLASVRRLRDAHYDVASVTEDAPGITDHEVLTRAQQEGRIVVTFDRDYGELLYRKNFSATMGIVYFRFHPYSPLEPAEMLLHLLKVAGIELMGKFTVVEKTGIRQRCLPIKK